MEINDFRIPTDTSQPPFWWYLILAGAVIAALLIVPALLTYITLAVIL
ncbi:hypothetical protein AALI21_02875 [Corynebacteriaceae bacterium 6-324]